MFPIFLILSLQSNSNPISPETYLGELGAETLFVQQRFAPIPESTYCWLTLRFLKRKSGKIVSFLDFTVWVSQGVPDTFLVDYLVDNGRRQVFVSMIAQSITSYVLDYDGKRVNILYEPGQGRWYGGSEGRVSAQPVWDSHGRFGIKEAFWAKTRIVNGHWKFYKTPHFIHRTIYLKKSG